MAVTWETDRSPTVSERDRIPSSSPDPVTAHGQCGRVGRAVKGEIILRAEQAATVTSSARVGRQTANSRDVVMTLGEEKRIAFNETTADPVQFTIAQGGAVVLSMAV